MNQNYYNDYKNYNGRGEVNMVFGKVLKSFLPLVLLLNSSTFLAFAEGNIVQNNGDVINQTNIFIDLKEDNWAYQAVSDMKNRGVISGYEDGTFKPQNPVSREEFAKLITATFNLDLVNQPQPDFTDVLPNKWSYQFVETAKDFLTGYYPPKGKAFFDPEAPATREDVAVALVNALGLSKNDLKDKNILSRKFTDADKISYSLRDNVAIATEKGLINGYDIGTFGPNNPVSRAEAATLLYRTIKGSVSDANAPIQLSAEVFGVAGFIGTYQIAGSTDPGSKVTINDQNIQVNDKGQFQQTIHYDKEGIYNFNVTSTKNGKTASVKKELNFNIPAPVINLDIPDTATSSQINISGTVVDRYDQQPAIYLNDNKLNTYSGGVTNKGYTSKFDNLYTLQAGENNITLRAKNSYGKETTVTKKITLNAEGPVISFDNDIPNTTSNQNLIISGKVKDKNDPIPHIYIYLNDVNVDLFQNSGFTKYLTLTSGGNEIKIKAIDNLNQQSTVTKTVYYQQK